MGCFLSCCEVSSYIIEIVSLLFQVVLYLPSRHVQASDLFRHEVVSSEDFPSFVDEATEDIRVEGSEPSFVDLMVHIFQA